MTQVADIIEKAFFEAGLTTELQHATPTQTNNAMDTLAGIITLQYGTNVGEIFEPWPLGNYGRSANVRRVVLGNVLTLPPANSMLIATQEEALTVYLPVNPSPGSRFGIVDPYNRLATYPVTLDGNGRSVESAASVLLDTDGANTQWLYRDDLGGWVKITPLLITDEMPFPADFDQMFIILLAMRLSIPYGQSQSPMQQAFLKGMSQQFQARYAQSLPLQINPEIAFPTPQSYDNFASGFWGGGTQAWNQGFDGWAW